MTTKRYFQISSKTSGAEIGTFAGATEDEALDAMARDAGYEGWEDAVATLIEGRLAYSLEPVTAEELAEQERDDLEIVEVGAPAAADG